jgi:aconitate hydratase
VPPLQFRDADSIQSLSLVGDEEFEILGMDDLKPQQELTLVVKRTDGSRRNVLLRSKIETAVKVDYCRHGGILSFVLREILARK